MKSEYDGDISYNRTACPPLHFPACIVDAANEAVKRNLLFWQGNGGRILRGPAQGQACGWGRRWRVRPQRGQSTLSALKFGGTLSFRPHGHVRNEKPFTFRMMSPIWRACLAGGSCACRLGFTGPERDFSAGQGGSGDDVPRAGDGYISSRIVPIGRPLGHAAQDADALGDRGVRAGQVGEAHSPASLEGVGDVHRGRGFAGRGQLGRWITGDLLQCAGQALRVAGQPGGAGVGQVLAPAGQGKVEQIGHDRGQNSGGNRNQQEDGLCLPTATVAGSSVVASPSSHSTSRAGRLERAG